MKGKRKASPCQVAFGNRLAARGKVLAPYVLAWLQGRGGGHVGTHPIAAIAMRELTQIGRDFLEEDKEEGRLPMLEYTTGLLADGFLYCDRKAKRPRRRPAPAGDQSRIGAGAGSASL